MITSFVKEPMSYENLKQYGYYKLHQALEEYGSFKKLPDEIKNIAVDTFTELWNNETYKSAVYRSGGWRIDYTKWCNLYWVRIRNYGIVEIRAFNKTMIRKCSCNPSHIIHIIEIK